MSLTAAVLRLLADLAPSGGGPRSSVLDVTSGGRPLLWLGTQVDPWALLHGDGSPDHVADLGADVLDRLVGGTVRRAAQTVGLDRSLHEGLRRLAATDALHREEQLLRVGWGWVARAPTDGEPTRVLHPLLAAPVGVVDRELGASLVRTGDTELTPLIRTDEAAALAARPALGEGGLAGFALTSATLDRFPAMAQWLRRAAAAAGFEGARLVGPEHDPRRSGSGAPVVVAGLGVYLARDVDASDLATTLRNWAAVPGVDRTALAQVLTPEAALTPAVDPEDPPHPPPVHLSDAQRTAVHRARRDQVTVVSGPPGSGKSHTVTAIALDAVAAGHSVLVATQTGHAADVLTDALHQLPGPAPVVFGGGRRRSALAAELAGGLDAGADRRELTADEQAARAAAARADWLRDGIAGLLRTEQQAARLEATGALSGLLLADVPGAADPDADLDALTEHLRQAQHAATGWWSRRRRHRAERRLRATIGAGDAVPLDRIDAALDLARSRRAAAELATRGGTTIGAAWDELARAEDERLLADGALLTDRARSGAARDRRARSAVVNLATALRAGRAARREHLRALDAGPLLDALPLWVGTVRDIEDLLPARPGLFDLVILDEASQLDLPRAALALVRARRAVVVGDPAQLRHVSFVADASVERAVAAHGLQPFLGRLDVRRVSAFDAAAGVAPVLRLDEHFRSAPHLIDFSARRFYPGVVHLATRHPTNDHHDVIDTVVVDPEVDDHGVHRSEVAAVEAAVRALADGGWRSIGVVTPFRAQADALEAMLLDRFTLEEIEHLGLRVGTVHAFQGAERDVVVLSLALADDDPAGRRRFVEDPNLFNVMVTRARHRLVVVTSLTDAPDGLVADYLHHAEQPPGPPEGAPPDDRWTAALATELERSGLACRTGYPVGRWQLDLVLGDGDDAVAVETRVHPAGPGAHIDRHLQLCRAGWRIVEAFPSRHDDDPVRAALAVVAEARR